MKRLWKKIHVEENNLRKLNVQFDHFDTQT